MPKKKLKTDKKKKNVASESFASYVSRKILPYFALNLQSAHKMWGRKV